MTAFVQSDGSLLCNRGCFSGSVIELEAEIQKTHGDSQHGREYRAAVALIKARFKIE